MGGFWANGWNIIVNFYIHIPFSRTSPQVRPFDRFSRVVCVFFGLQKLKMTFNSYLGPQTSSFWQKTEKYEALACRLCVAVDWKLLWLEVEGARSTRPSIPYSVTDFKVEMDRNIQIHCHHMITVYLASLQSSLMIKKTARKANNSCCYWATAYWNANCRFCYQI